MDAAAWGIEPGYYDYRGQWFETPPETAAALLEAMGAGEVERPPAVDDLVFARPGDHVGPGLLTLEDGGDVDLGDGGVLPPDVPFGYHSLDGRRVVVSPGRCFLPDGLRTWGWAVQLYAARSAASWGIGDLADLRTLATWAAGQGAGMLLVNPLHASLPTVQTASPYFPSSRCFRNPVYLRVDGPVPEGLNDQRVIDREAVWGHKSAALEASFAAFGGDAGFDRFVAAGGAVLAGYATFCALAEEHGLPWFDWPADAAAAVDPQRVRYHQWLQWQVDGQLAAAGEPLDLMQDLAIGVDPAGADAWLWRDVFALGVRVGAPPDEFNTRGQDWGVPPFDPWRLRAAHYEPFIQTIRAGLRHAGGIRIDHVMGLFRLFWIPPGAEDARAGTYVRYPFRELLDIVALESHRAGAYVVGEDLGTVTDEMRHELSERDVLSYRLLWFEPGPPPTFPARSLAAVTTHDLPTIAGMWSGSDLAELERLGLEANVEGTRAIHERLQDWLDVPADAPPAEVVARAYGLLAQAPSAVVTATLDDALLVEERPNVPGTTDERPNWSLALPRPLEDVLADLLVAEVARRLNAR